MTAGQKYSIIPVFLCVNVYVLCKDTNFAGENAAQCPVISLGTKIQICSALFLFILWNTFVMIL